VPPVAGRPPMPEASSGFGHLLGGKPLVSNIRMANYSFDASGFFTVALEDGEAWQESSSWPTLAKWKLPPASYYVSILPGMLGSYDLKVRGMNGYFKVHRLRQELFLGRQRLWFLRDCMHSQSKTLA
jgi:hypothetical protein